MVNIRDLNDLKHVKGFFFSGIYFVSTIFSIYSKYISPYSVVHLPLKQL